VMQWEVGHECRGPRPHRQFDKAGLLRRPQDLLRAKGEIGAAKAGLDGDFPNAGTAPRSQDPRAQYG
jgi:hypothetical protein